MARLASGQPGFAIQPLSRAIALVPTLAGAYRNLSSTYTDLEQVERAKEVLQKLLDLQPNISDRDILRNWIMKY